MTNGEKVGYVRIKDLPDSVKVSFLQAIANFTVGFLRPQDTPDGQDISLIGTGTLVTVNNVHAILTAAHVIDALPQTGQLGLVFGDRKMGTPTVSTEGLHYLKIARGDVESEGPDLGAVILSPSIASALRAKLVFHNLDLQRDRLLNQPPDIHDGIWTVQGFVGDLTEEQFGVDGYRKTVGFHELSSFGLVEPGYAVGEHDYFIIIVDYRHGSTMPRNFGGTSGGGLWQIRLIRKESTGEFSHHRPILSGVAFYQEAIVNDERGIKCHGRRSVYKIAYDAIKTAGQ